MNNSAEKTSYFQKVLERTGGWYLVIAMLVTQVFSSVSAFAAEYSIQVNAEFSASQLNDLVKFATGGILTTNLLVLVFVYLTYGDVREKLTLWSRGENTSLTPREEITIWNQITSLTWRYSLFLFISSLVVTMLPVFYYQVAILKVETDQILYTLLGGFAAILGEAALSLLILDRFLKPAYKILLPKSAEGRHIKARGISISIKLQSVTLALILTSILLIAPIGYHQTVQALRTGNNAVLRTMQVQSLFVTFLTVLFGILLSALFARSVSSPLQELIQTFNKIEEGDLTQRAIVTAPDEIGELAIYFNSMVSRLDTLQSNLETQINIRTEQLKATSEVGHVVSSILDPDKLIEEIANLITERLGYYYAAIFLISPNGAWAELKAATGEAGKELRAKQHRLSLSGKSMVGSAISLKEARIAHDVGQEAVRFNNPLLPETRSEIALPLIAGGHVLGALDAQSTEANAFDEDVIETLQAMANQVAVALENARLYQEAQQALEESRSTQRAQLRSAWSDTLDTRGDLEYSTGEATSVDESTLNVPLALRDQIIGEISLEGNPNWGEDEKGWVEAVATQAALALENARLLEESQQIALQERLVAEITGKIWSSTTTDGILKIAIKELGNALGASEGVIELKLEEGVSNTAENKEL